MMYYLRKKGKELHAIVIWIKFKVFKIVKDSMTLPLKPEDPSQRQLQSFEPFPHHWHISSGHAGRLSEV